MKILYDSVSKDYSYPLSKRDVKSLLFWLPESIYSPISSIRFGCNTKTTQEARIVQRVNKVYDIRVNFCLKANTSIFLIDRERYTKPVIECGGVIDKSKGLVHWDDDSAKTYASYLLLHEVGHIVLMEGLSGHFNMAYGTTKEEEWCDKYAFEMVQKYLKELSHD